MRTKLRLSPARTVTRLGKGLSGLLLFGASLFAVAGECVPADAAMAGRYELDAGGEGGSILLLRADGQFEFAVAHGGLDSTAQGCWRRTGDRVVELVASSLAPPEIKLVREVSGDGTGDPASMEPLPLTDAHEGAIGDSALIGLNTGVLTVGLRALPVWVEYADGRVERQVIDGKAEVHVQRPHMPAIRRIGIALAKDAAQPEKWLDNDEPARRLFFVQVDVGEMSRRFFDRVEFWIEAPHVLVSPGGQYRRTAH